MRILQVSPYFSPYLGGQERHVWDLARSLVDLGHDVEIVSSNFPKSVESETLDGVTVRRFRTMSRLLNNPICPGLFPFLLKHLGDFDVIHAHNEHASSSLFCALLRTGRKFPFVLTHHGQLKFGSPSKDMVERAYSRSLGSRILRNADRVIALSNSEMMYLHSRGVPVDRIRVIPNGVDLSRYDVRIDLPEPDNLAGRRRVLFVGPLITRKGIHVLARAIPSIIEKHSEIVFVFVGEGEARKETEAICRSLHVESHVWFAGRVSDEQLLQLYRRSEVFVLPSFSEGLPYSIIDAMAYSKPVVSTKIPSITESLKGTALLVSPGNHKELAQAISTLLNDEGLASEMGERGRALVESTYQLQRSVQATLDLYSEVVGR
jgi:glycosyltransferase involved in cell wall biosynthesis